MYDMVKEFSYDDSYLESLASSELRNRIKVLFHQIRGMKKKDVRKESGKILEQMADIPLLRPSTVAWAAWRGVDLNASLPTGLRFADKLAQNDMLTPQLIACLSEKGYDFQSLNDLNQHIGYYLIPSAPLVIALKEEGVDFFKNMPMKIHSSDDESFVEILEDSIAETLLHRAQRGEISLVTLFEKREDWYLCQYPQVIEEAFYQQIRALKPEKLENFNYIALCKYNRTAFRMAAETCRGYSAALKKRAPYGLKENHPFWDQLKEENQNKR